MPQSNVIFAFLFVSFLVWITMKGELPTYLNYLLHAAASGSGTGTTQSLSDATPAGSTAPSAPETLGDASSALSLATLALG